jgi:ABC-type transport system involved in cytochrome c biogenesis permease subunit
LVDVLFWPAVLGYGEAAVALGAEAKRPGRAGRLAIWGVRLGWLAQTALLVGQALRSDGFPWSSWAGALVLFSWLVVGAYLVYGSRPRFRLLGLAVLPVAAALLVAAYAGGGADERGDGTSWLLATHVALMLSAFAGFTVAAGLSGFYLWHERRLKRREATVLRLRVPPLETLDAVTARTIAVSLATLTAGIVLGLGSLVRDGGGFDTAMGGTLAAWCVYAAFLLLRRHRALQGRPAARLSLLALLVVVAVFPVVHFA